MDPEQAHPPYVGGPVCTRTADRSLHVNLTPGTERWCNFDCVYCPFPRSRGRQFPGWPRPGNVGSAVMQALRGDPPVESITISGPGEPTLHPHFGHALAEVLSARQTHPLPVRVVTNGTTVLEPRVRRLLAFADERVVRIDAGGERISRPRKEASPEALAAALRELPDFSVESVFIEGPARNTGDDDLREWIARLAQLRPGRVYVTTIAEPALDSTVAAASPAELERIADRLRRETGLSATVIP